MRVGVEVGGTFTDLYLVDDGNVRVTKVPSTPQSPDIGVLNAIDQAGIELTKVNDFVHGSTVATNAVLERKGGRIGFLVTKGMRDIFALQRHDRTVIYDLHYRKPQPVVDNQDILEIDERMAADGKVVQPLNLTEAESNLSQYLSQRNVDALAVCLLHSYANSEHEQALAGIVRSVAPDLPLTCSHEVSPEFREYERASTTALAAYVQPVIEGYLDRLVQQLQKRGFTGHFSVMQSNGGCMPAEAMGRNAISALFSGPAAGVIGAIRSVETSGYRNVITFDMGGTSTDVSLVNEGQPEITPQTKIDGLPVRSPVIDIATVGAGGGSVAWIDDGGLMRVGPQSAGAVPGPASYGRGGTEPTVTDAHLIRGTLQPQSFLDGKMRLDREAAVSAYEQLANSTQLSLLDAADSVVRLAEANIVRAIQQISTERGRDAREYVLVPYGGAGPLHAARVAESLAIPKVVIPPDAGVLSAVGLLKSDYVHYRSKTQRTRLSDAALPIVRSILAGLKDETTAYLVGLGLDQELGFQFSLDMRYVGQAFEVSVSVPDDLENMTLEMIIEEFREAHHRVFEFSKPPNDPAEIVSFRIAGSAVESGADLERATRNERESMSDGTRVEIRENGQTLNCVIIKRSSIGSETRPGPAIIDDGTSTVFVPPGWTACDDENGLLILKHGE